VPIVAGYFIAHYWSLLVIVGQQAVVQLSDPLGTGANWLRTGGRAADPTLAGATTTAVVQVCAVVQSQDGTAAGTRSGQASANAPTCAG